MKKYINKTILKDTLILTTTLLMMEIIFRLFLHYPIREWSILRITLSLLSISLFVNLLLSFIKKQWLKYLFNVIVILASSCYAIMQAGFYHFIGVFVSLGSSTQLGAVKDYIKDFFNSFNPLFYTMLIPFVIYLLYLFLREQKSKKAKSLLAVKKTTKRKLTKKQIQKIKEEEEKEKKLLWVQRGVLTLGLIVIIIFYVLTLNIKFMQNDLQMEENKNLFKNPTIPNLCINQFGTTVFGLLDLKTFLFPVEENNFIGKEDPVEENEITDFTRHIDDTIWKSLMNDSENTKNQQILNDYFMNRAITSKNEYTGLLKDKNLVMIMLESVNTIFINEEYFPNMYKIYTGGYSWNNSYSPRNDCATGNNEMSGMTSLFSIYKTCTANVYKQNKYPQSIFNLFNQIGYKTTSFHDYTEQYYARREIHANMYSKRYYDVEDLNIPYQTVFEEWPSDVDLIDKAYPLFTSEDKPFMTWLTTVSPHQPYYASSEMGDKHLALFQDLNCSQAVKRYLSKLKELDLALGKLMELLENDNKLDDTVFVLYGDHYPYGLSTEDLSVYFNYDVNKANLVEKTPFVIYNSELGGKEFDEFTSYINILPTIANLFDLNYDPRYYMGSDLLSDDYENKVIFADGSWENDIAIYNAATAKITYKGSKNYTNEEIKRINLNIANRMKMSSLAIKENYFNYLFEGLEKHRLLLEDQVNNAK